MKKLLSAAAVLACSAGITVAAAGPAQASATGCPTNNFCLYSETQYQSTTDLIFHGNGTTMFNSPNTYFSSDQLKRYSAVYVANLTQGYFCTYNQGMTRLGRFAPGTVAPIPAGSPYGTNWQVYYVKYC